MSFTTCTGHSLRVTGARMVHPAALIHYFGMSRTVSVDVSTHVHVIALSQPNPLILLCACIHYHKDLLAFAVYLSPFMI